MPDIVEVNAATGEVTERDFTPAELAQRQADQAEYAIRQAAIEVTEGNRATIESRAVTALQGNRDFLALAAPTQADALAQVKDLTRQNTALIRLLLNLLEATD